ncbi:hypothetical protein KBC70_04200 [Candidatus Woesebacteria bacterium]|nr:hypothetical protein [Candidatus Woesebacteria bacterium]
MSYDPLDAFMDLERLEKGWEGELMSPQAILRMLGLPRETSPTSVMTYATSKEGIPKVGDLAEHERLKFWASVQVLTSNQENWEFGLLAEDMRKTLKVIIHPIVEAR